MLAVELTISSLKPVALWIGDSCLSWEMSETFFFGLKGITRKKTKNRWELNYPTIFCSFLGSRASYTPLLSGKIEQKSEVGVSCGVSTHTWSGDCENRWARLGTCLLLRKQYQSSKTEALGGETWNSGQGGEEWSTEIKWTQGIFSGLGNVQTVNLEGFRWWCQRFLKVWECYVCFWWGHGLKDQFFHPYLLQLYCLGFIARNPGKELLDSCVCVCVCVCVCACTHVHPHRQDAPQKREQNRSAVSAPSFLKGRHWRATLAKTDCCTSLAKRGEV